METSLIGRRSFDRELDFYVATPLTVANVKFTPGDLLDKTLLSTRLLRQLYENRDLTNDRSEVTVLNKKKPKIRGRNNRGRPA